MAIDIDDVFAGIKDAKARVDANYIRPGHYICVVRKAKLDKNRKKKIFFALEMTVLECIHADNIDRAHRPGEDVSHLLMEEWDGFLPDVKALLSSLLVCPEDDIDVAACKLVVGDSQPLEHVIVEVKARNKVTNNDKDFTIVRYERVLSDEEALERYSTDFLLGHKVEVEGMDEAEEEGEDGTESED